MSTNVVRMSEIDPEGATKVSTGMSELDAVLDGGTIPGQVILIAGPPGVGKSTITLEVADAMSKRGVLKQSGKIDRKKKNRILLVSTEEDVEKIRARSLRIKKGENILLCHNKEMSEIESDFAEHQPEFGIIDSLSKIKEAHGLQGQVDTLQRIYEYAHATFMTTIVTAHVNGEGEIAGMIALQHTADTVLLFGKDQKDSMVRTLRVLKNRHGSEDYVGLFEMTEKGIWPFDPTKNIDSVNLQPGQAFAIATLGGKSFPIEVQALTTVSARPRIVVVGYSHDRVQMILAAIAEHTPIDVSNRDVYVTILGGVNFSDTSVDAAIAMAIMSTVAKKPLLSRTAYSGEVDLIGRLKLGERMNQQREIAERHGFKLVSGESLEAIMSQVKGLG